jgi:hypothetical protein
MNIGIKRANLIDMKQHNRYLNGGYNAILKKNKEPSLTIGVSHNKHRVKTMLGRLGVVRVWGLNNTTPARGEETLGQF